MHQINDRAIQRDLQGLGPARETAAEKHPRGQSAHAPLSHVCEASPHSGASHSGGCHLGRDQGIQLLNTPPPGSPSVRSELTTCSGLTHRVIFELARLVGKVADLHRQPGGIKEACYRGRKGAGISSGSEALALQED